MANQQNSEMNHIKYCTTRATVDCILLIINKETVDLLLKIVLLLYYYSATGFLGVFILTLAVKPFGYSRKVFRL